MRMTRKRVLPPPDYPSILPHGPNTLFPDPLRPGPARPGPARPSPGSLTPGLSDSRTVRYMPTSGSGQSGWHPDSPGRSKRATYRRSYTRTPRYTIAYRPYMEPPPITEEYIGYFLPRVSEVMRLPPNPPRRPLLLAARRPLGPEGGREEVRVLDCFFSRLYLMLPYVTYGSIVLGEDRSDGR